MTASPAINLGRQFVFWWQSYEKSFRICRHCICGTIFGSFSHDTKSSGMKSYHTCTFKYYFKQMHEAWKPVQSLIHSHIYKKYISKTLILPSMRQDTFNWLHERCMTCRMIRMLRYLVMSVQVTLLRSHRSNKPLNLTELNNLSNWKNITELREISTRWAQASGGSRNLDTLLYTQIKHLECVGWNDCKST